MPKPSKNPRVYSEYKPTGVSYLGDVPTHWKLVPGFVAFKENRRTNKGMKEQRVLSLSYGKIIVKPKEKLVGLVPESFETYQVARPGDIIIRCTDLQNDTTSLRTGFVQYTGIITSAYLNLRPNNEFSSRYVYYILHSLDITKYIYKLGSGLRQNLSYDDFKHLSVPLFSLHEQDAIAYFLDQKSTQIDRVIRVKVQQINLLKERKQILIQNAATRGLNPDAPMRDSGVDWIGELPAHWEQVRLKNVSNFITSGPRGWSEYFSEHGAYFLQSGNLNESMGIELESAVKVNPPKGAEGLRTRLLDGDVLVCVTGAKTGKVALAKISDHQEVYVNQHLCLVRPTKSILPEFLALVLHSVVGQTYFFLQQYGLKQGLGLDDVNEAPILLPPSSEQQAIVDYVNAELIKQNKAALLLEQQITKLKEYKATLINSAVTGKIKVPGVVEPAQGMNEPEAREVCQ